MKHIEPYPGVERSLSDSGEVTYEVEPGETYAFGVVSKTEDLIERVITIQEGEWVTRRTLRLSPPHPSAKLTVRVLTPAGEPVSFNHRTAVLGLRTGVLVTGTPEFFTRPEYVRTIAAGTYEIAVDADIRRSLNVRKPVGRRQYAGVRDQFSINPGEEKTIEIRLGEGGYLELTADHDGTPDFTRWPESASHEGDDDWSRKQRERVRAARVRLTRIDDGTIIVPLFELPRTERAILSVTAEGDWVASGTTTASSTLIPVGDYILRAETPGYPPVETEVRFRADETLPVSVTLSTLP